ncbi:MAG: hypothetical protein PVH68_19690 [Armatimonadota bacterium]|jgi:hypothetical protein
MRLSRRADDAENAPLPVTVRARLARWLSTSPAARYVLAAIALAVVVAAGFAVRYWLRPNATPAGPPGTIAPTASVGQELRDPTDKGRVLLPLVARGLLTLAPSPTSEPSPRPKPAEPTSTPTPAPVDFASVRQELQSEGKDLAYVKLGFHTGPGGTARGLGTYLSALAGVGVPAVIKSVGDYGVCVQALRESPDHVTIFRMTGGELELPSYDLPPETAADQHWARIREALPPEFDQRTWLEVMNEPDKARADWLGRFASRTAQLALRDGYRFAAFGWSSGEPEPEHWQTPGMLAFLRLASQHPDRIAVALHEYSYDVDNIANQYPALVGRFQTLFRICDQDGIGRPTVLITEWGWEYTRVPPVEQAMKDIAWASQLYAAYPEVRGAGIWYLGGSYGGIADRAQRLILPLRYYTWSTYFVIEPGQKPTDPGRFAP